MTVSQKKLNQLCDEMNSAKARWVKGEISESEFEAARLRFCKARDSFLLSPTKAAE